MTALQAFDLYTLSEPVVDRGGSPVRTAVLVFSDAIGTFGKPSSSSIKEWFGEGQQYDLAVSVMHNLVNAPLGGLDIFTYLDLDKYDTLYVVPKFARSPFYNVPFRIKTVQRAVNPGSFEISVCGLSRVSPDERVHVVDGFLEVI